MQYSQEHLKTMVYAKFGGQTECIMGNWKIENGLFTRPIMARTQILVHRLGPRTSISALLRRRT